MRYLGLALLRLMCLLGPVLLSIRPARAQAPRPVVVITVKDSQTGAALAGVSVSLSDVGIVQSTDGSGQVHLLMVPHGKHRLEARRIGYDPAQLVMDVGEQDTTSVTVSMHATPRRLDTVAVIGASARQHLSEFEQRRAAGIGQFITTQQLDSMPGASLDAIFATHIRGVRINGGRSVGMYITSLRPQTEHGLIRAPRGVCPPLVYVDGVPLASNDERGADISLLELNSVAAIEVYSAAEIPARYRTYGTMASRPPGGAGSTPACGAVLLWTGR